MAAPLRADIKKILLDSCEKQMAEKSFDAISLADIANSAGVSKGTLYHYYKSKDDLLFDLTNRYLEQLDRDLMKWINDPAKDTSYKRMARYVLQHGVYKSGGAMRLHLLAASVGENDVLRKRFLEKYVYFRRTLTEKIKQRKPGTDAEYQAWMMLTLTDGLLIQTLLGNDAFDVDDFIEKTVFLLDAQQ